MSENMTSSNKSPEGMDLLGGLYTVYQYLQDTNEKLTRYWEL